MNNTPVSKGSGRRAHTGENSFQVRSGAGNLVVNLDWESAYYALPSPCARMRQTLAHAATNDDAPLYKLLFSACTEWLMNCHGGGGRGSAVEVWPRLRREYVGC